MLYSVSEPLATSFGSTPGRALLDAGPGAAYAGYTSFVQYRGSIPVMWHQESTQLTARPPIESEPGRPFIGILDLTPDSHYQRPILHARGETLRRPVGPIWRSDLYLESDQVSGDTTARIKAAI